MSVGSALRRPALLRAASWRLPAAVLIVWALAVAAGAGLAVRLVHSATAGASSRAGTATGVVEPGPRPARLGQSIRTSFGVVAGEAVIRVDGLSAHSLSGASHGISGLVRSGQAQVQVTVALTNLSDRPVTWRPTQFTLRLGGGGRHEVRHPTGGSIHAGSIQPDAAVEGHLDFVVPADGARMFLVFRDRGRAPVVIRAGRLPVRLGESDDAH